METEGAESQFPQKGAGVGTGTPAAWEQPRQETLPPREQTEVSSWKDQEGTSTCDRDGQGPRTEMEN